MNKPASRMLRSTVRYPYMSSPLASLRPGPSEAHLTRPRALTNGVSTFPEAGRCHDAIVPIDILEKPDESG